MIYMITVEPVLLELEEIIEVLPSMHLYNAPRAGKISRLLRYTRVSTTLYVVVYSSYQHSPDHKPRCVSRAVGRSQVS